MKPMSTSHRPTSAAVQRIGCVSYLNAKPLIDGIEGSNPIVRFDVPSALLGDLEIGAVDIALCPVIDYYRSTAALEVVPVGGISSAAQTLTVRLYSQVPIDQVTTIHADVDSHTSVVLVRVLLQELHGIRPAMIDFASREHEGDLPQSMLLIGDKVVTASPDDAEYPHQLDLGEAWHGLTGLPFLFAVWMSQEGASLGNLPQLLDAQRRKNLTQLTDIADRSAPVHGWPLDLARQYLGGIMQYNVGEPELKAMQHFGELAYGMGLIDELRPLRLRG